jgi:DNA-binding Xre family transcriptional regulator
MSRFLVMQSRPKYRVEIRAGEVTRRRLERALSRSQLAREAGISESRLNKIEAGLGGGVLPDTVQGLCRVLECEPRDISFVEEVAS